MCRLIIFYYNFYLAVAWVGVGGWGGGGGGGGGGGEAETLLRAWGGDSSVLRVEWRLLHVGEMAKSTNLCKVGLGMRV